MKSILLDTSESQGRILGGMWQITKRICEKRMVENLIYKVNYKINNDNMGYTIVFRATFYHLVGISSQFSMLKDALAMAFTSL